MFKSYTLNKRITGMRCLKCGKIYQTGDYFYGCPNCLEKARNSALTFIYEGPAAINTAEQGWKRYSSMLPYDNTVTLGEGFTPVVALPLLAEMLGLGAVYTKNEFQNPTGSHKDRMNPFITARAAEMGYDTVTCASSGNEAASLAAYAAAEGLKCVNVATKNIPDHWKAASDSCKANLVTVQTAPERLAYQRENMAKGWYPATNLLDVPTASCAFGIQGYKTLSFELYERFGEELPEYIFIPSCRGDLLYGIYEGLEDLRRYGYISRLPRLVACEPNPRLELVLKGHSHTETFVGNTACTASIGGITTTYQAELALRNSDGFAVSVSQQQALQALEEMGTFGFYLETSSAIVLPCMKKAIEEGKLPQQASVLLVLTSNGYKNRVG